MRAHLDVEVLERGLDALDRAITEQVDSAIGQLEGSADAGQLIDDLVELAASAAELERRWHRLPLNSIRRDSLGRTEASLQRLALAAKRLGKESAILPLVRAVLADVALASARWQAGLAIKNARIERGLSGRALAKAIGTSSGYMSELEMGKAAALPSEAICSRLDAALNADIGALVANLRSNVDGLFAASRAAIRHHDAGRLPETDSDVRVELARRALRADRSLLDLLEATLKLPAPLRHVVMNLASDLARANEGKLE